MTARWSVVGVIEPAVANCVGNVFILAQLQDNAPGRGALAGLADKIMCLDSYFCSYRKRTIFKRFFVRDPLTSFQLRSKS